MRFNNINDMDRTKDACRHQSNNRVIMWYKIRELYSKGFNKTQIAFQLGLHRSTVRRYLKMDEDTLTAKLQHRRQYPRILDKYESYVCDILSRYRFLSASQIHDWMKEQYPDLPVVCGKTVYNFVETVRRKYNLDKEGLSKRVYEKMPDTPYGEYAQMDFGESRMPTYRNDFVKVYFFVMVMSRSRQKFVYFSCTPFTSALAVYAHELAFAYFGGKPRMGFDIDYPGKDSYRHRAAGASEVVIAAPDMLARVKMLQEEVECNNIVRSMPGHDIIVVEGYRKSGLPTIEIMRSGNPADVSVAQVFVEGARSGASLGTDFTQIARGVAEEHKADLKHKMPTSDTVAIVTDIPEARDAATLYNIPAFDLNNTGDLVDFLEDHYVRPRVTVVIQAGGESRRMGQSKATVPFAGRPLICRLVERLGELQQIIKEKPQDYSCPFVLSMIHASKGLEYDAVYLLDVIDGILPA